MPFPIASLGIGRCIFVPGCTFWPFHFLYDCFRAHLEQSNNTGGDGKKIAPILEVSSKGPLAGTYFNNPLLELIQSEVSLSVC